MEKCPQALKIPELLEAVVEELEGPELQKKLAMIKKVFHAKF
jgi:predicted aldo/keto reductase-like oxidoreductase